MTDIPGGVERKVANVAVAWEITKRTYLSSVDNSVELDGTVVLSSDERLKLLTNGFIKAFKAIWAERPID